MARWTWSASMMTLLVAIGPAAMADHGDELSEGRHDRALAWPSWETLTLRPPAGAIVTVELESDAAMMFMFDDPLDRRRGFGYNSVWQDQEWGATHFIADPPGAWHLRVENLGDPGSEGDPDPYSLTITYTIPDHFEYLRLDGGTFHALQATIPEGTFAVFDGDYYDADGPASGTPSFTHLQWPSIDGTKVSERVWGYPARSDAALWFSAKGTSTRTPSLAPAGGSGTGFNVVVGTSTTPGEYRLAAADIEGAGVEGWLAWMGDADLSLEAVPGGSAEYVTMADFSEGTGVAIASIGYAKDVSSRTLVGDNAYVYVEADDATTIDAHLPDGSTYQVTPDERMEWGSGPGAALPGEWGFTLHADLTTSASKASIVVVNLPFPAP